MATRIKIDISQLNLEFDNGVMDEVYLTHHCHPQQFPNLPITSAQRQQIAEMNNAGNGYSGGHGKAVCNHRGALINGIKPR